MPKQTKLPEELKVFLTDMTNTPDERERVLLLIDSSKLSDEAKELAKEVINEAIPPQEKELAGALQTEGMQEFIDSKVKSAVDPLKEELATAKTTIEDLEKKIEEAGDVEALKTSYRNSLIDSIVDLKLALRKKEINLTKVEDSIQAVKDGLKETSEEDLEKEVSDLQSELLALFGNSPTEKLDKSVAAKDNQSDENEKDDEEDKLEDSAEKIKSLDDLALTFLAIPSKKGKKAEAEA